MTRVTSKIFTDGSLTKKASLNAVASAVDQSARTIANLVITPFLVTRLGDSVFGIWKVLQGLIGQASPASGRPGEALKWTVAHHHESIDYEQKRHQVGNAVAVWFLFLPFLFLPFLFAASRPFFLVKTSATRGWVSPPGLSSSQER